MLKKITALLLAVFISASLAACNITSTESETQNANSTVSTVQTANQYENTTDTAPETSGKTKSSQSAVTVANTTSNGAINANDMFTERDLEQTADTSEAKYYTVSDGTDISITSDGVYVISGTASNVTVTVDADDEDKVQIVLDGVSVTNSDFPVIYIKNADKVFITTTSSENMLSVTGTFKSDGDTNTDAVIFSRDDIVLNGTGTLTVNSTDNGISCKDDLKVTGGNLIINCVSDALEANDSIAIADGSITATTQKDGLHAENDDDNSTGYIYICGGTLNITAKDDGIHATTIVQIDDGNITVSGAEGIEGTYIQINGGTINISASDDGINGARKSSAYTVTVEFNGGYTTIVMGAGDTDGVDSNGNLYINGGTVDVTGQSTFDYDGTAQYNGGTIIVNGTQTDTIPNQMMGGGMRGGFGGGNFGGRHG